MFKCNNNGMQARSEIEKQYIYSQKLKIFKMTFLKFVRPMLNLFPISLYLPMQHYTCTFFCVHLMSKIYCSALTDNYQLKMASPN